MAPGDLEGIADYWDLDPEPDWIEQHFLASDGALAIRDGKLTGAASIVPAQRSDGSCVFLHDEKCSIHPVSPFGCSRFDDHQSIDESEQRAEATLLVQIDSFDQGDGYAKVHALLSMAGRVAPPLSERRAAYRNKQNRIIEEQLHGQETTETKEEGA